MQEETMAWDPASIDRVIPWAPRLYVLFLFFVLVVAIVRLLRLAWNVSCFSKRKQVSIQNLATASLDDSQLAISALGNNFDKRVFDRQFVINSDPSARRDVLSTLEDAELRFRYLWQLCMNDVKALKRSTNLTLLASVFIALERLVDILRGIALTKVPAIAATSGSLAELSLLLAIGVGLGVIMYLLCIWFEGMLTLRETRWNYFYSLSKQRFSE